MKRVIFEPDHVADFPGSFFQGAQGDLVFVEQADGLLPGDASALRFCFWQPVGPVEGAVFQLLFKLELLLLCDFPGSRVVGQLERDQRLGIARASVLLGKRCGEIEPVFLDSNRCHAQWWWGIWGKSTICTRFCEAS